MSRKSFESISYTSADSVSCDNSEEAQNYPIELIVIYYTDFGAISNNNSNILIYKVIVIVIDF